MPIVVGTASDLNEGKNDVGLEKSPDRAAPTTVSGSSSSSNNRFSIENLLLPAPVAPASSVQGRSRSNSPTSTTRSTPEISPASIGSARQDPNGFILPTTHCSSILSHPGVISRTATTPRFHQSPTIASVADRHQEMVWAASAPLANPWMPYGCFSLEQSLVLAQRGEKLCSCYPFYFLILLRCGKCAF